MRCNLIIGQVLSGFQSSRRRTTISSMNTAHIIREWFKYTYNSTGRSRCSKVILKWLYVHSHSQSILDISISLKLIMGWFIEFYPNVRSIGYVKTLKQLSKTSVGPNHTLTGLRSKCAWLLTSVMKRGDKQTAGVTNHLNSLKPQPFLET